MNALGEFLPCLIAAQGQEHRHHQRHRPGGRRRVRAQLPKWAMIPVALLTTLLVYQSPAPGYVAPGE